MEFEETHETQENVETPPVGDSETTDNTASEPAPDKYLYDMPEEDFQRMIEGDTVDIPDEKDDAETPTEKTEETEEKEKTPETPKDEANDDEEKAFLDYLKELSGSEVKSVEELAKIHKDIRDKYSVAQNELSELDKFAKEHNYDSYKEMVEDIKSHKLPDEKGKEEEQSQQETSSQKQDLKHLSGIWDAEERQAEELDARMKRLLDERGESEDYAPTLPEVRRAREASSKIAQAIISDASEAIVPKVISALNERINPVLREFADMSARNGLKLAFSDLPQETREAHGAYAQNIIDYILENKSGKAKNYFEAHLKGENPFINGVIEEFINSHPDIKSMHSAEQKRRTQEYIDKKLAAEKKRMAVQRMGAKQDDTKGKSDPGAMNKAEREKYLNEAAKEALEMLNRD
jgi:hypothetical protein